MIRSNRGYGGKTFRLVTEDNQDVQIGQVFERRGEFHELLSARAPHKPSSTGRIHVRIDGEYTAEYFPGVCGLKWVEEVMVDRTE